MNVISIPYLEVLNEKSASAASAILGSELKYNYINNVNWQSEYPYCPDSKFKIARSEDSLFLKFIIFEQNLRALYANDQEAVYEDSCVEFFCKKPDSNTYMNFEFNCIGTAIATTRKGKETDVVPFSETQMKKIERFSSIGNEVFDEKEGSYNWELTVKIPFSIIGIDPNNLPEKMLGNFYKCADGTSSPHFVSWSPITTESPNFHCPEFFGELRFDI